MVTHFIFTRKVLASGLCLGSLLMGLASSAQATEATQLRPGEQGNMLVETLPPPARAASVIVEETGPFGLDSKGIKRRLAENLKTGTGLFPLVETRSFLGGELTMTYQVARPSIDAPFGTERAIMESPRLSNAVQRAVRTVFPN